MWRWFFFATYYSCYTQIRHFVICYSCHDDFIIDNSGYFRLPKRLFRLKSENFSQDAHWNRLKKPVLLIGRNPG